MDKKTEKNPNQLRSDEEIAAWSRFAAVELARAGEPLRAADVADQMLAELRKRTGGKVSYA